MTTEKATTKSSNYDDEWQAGDPIEGAPDFIRICADNDKHYLVKTRRGTFKLKELEWAKVEASRKRGEQAKRVAETLISDSVIGKNGEEKTFGELEIREWPGGTVMRLQAALTYIYEADVFLGQSSE